MSNPAPIPSRERLVESLREQMARLENDRRPGDGRPVVSSGSASLDRLLPDGGFRWGTLVEWLSAGWGTGRETLAFSAAREACREGGAVVVLDRAGEFYPPAALRLGIPQERMIVVRAADEGDRAWALDQALRCPAVGAAIAWPEKLDGHTFRRLQLAAEQGGGLGLLIRSDHARHEPSWAEVRLGIEPAASASPRAARRVTVCVLRSRDRLGGEAVEVEIDHETPPLHPVRRLAHPADPRRAARA